MQGEIANRRATQNNFVRQLGDISRTLKSMGLHHQIQVTPSAPDLYASSQACNSFDDIPSLLHAR